MQHNALKEWSVIEPIVEQMGYELVGTEIGKNRGHVVLRVYIDKPGGINLDDCAKVSHQLSGVLDVEDIIRGAYDLEVSSPGLDRPLFRLKDFERFTGSLVKIRMAVPYQGRRNFKGIILGINSENIVIEVDQKKFELLFNHIDQARLVPQL